MTHPFDPYADFTDLSALKEITDRPLRKSLRTNTLKCSTADMLAWGKAKGWTLTPVPWCKEGFFIDRPTPTAVGLRSASRPDDVGEDLEKPEALGKDFLHLIGAFYVQEAASMLPVSLLDPKPGERILDMSASPGSKTTQIAARMGLPAIADGGLGTNGIAHLRQGYGGRPSATAGVIVANDVQEKRIWALQTNLQRCGVTNACITRKTGQWFAPHMTEVFDRVLCDAPCTAQGTARKDDDALMYCSPDNIGKMAKLQRELLESAVHACKVGGRIVYSTCTLTPQENEDVVQSILNKFSDQLFILNPADILAFDFGRQIEDSARVQASLGQQKAEPMIRLWPQTLDTEGFFSVVIEKRAPTKHREVRNLDYHRWSILPNSRRKNIARRLEDWFGTSFIHEGEELFLMQEQLFLLPHDFLDFSLPVNPYMGGLPFGTFVSDGMVRLSHEILTLRGHEARKQVLAVTEEEMKSVLSGVHIPVSSDGCADGDILFSVGAPSMGQHIVFGRGMLKNGKVLNRLPRDIVKMFT